MSEFLAIGVHLLDATSVVPNYARICAGLALNPEYRAMGQNDLWIAAVAVSYNKPLLTRNRRHFDLIEGLRLEVLQQ